jgi:hypothetical protein
MGEEKEVTNVKNEKLSNLSIKSFFYDSSLFASFIKEPNEEKFSWSVLK